MTSVSPAPRPDHPHSASQSGRAGSPSVAAVAASAPLPPASQAPRSYAHATKSSISQSSSAVASGDQHARSAPVSNRASTAMAAPAVVTNGTSAPGDHARKPSVTISAAGATGYVSNGNITPSAQRAQINFGQFNNATDAGSAAASNSSLPAQASLSATQGNPRISTPAKSPSPIPQPQSASGGRPPSGFQSQNGPPHFGSMTGAENGVSAQVPGAPQGPGMPGQAVHLRRGSSQHSDMSSASTPYTPGNAPNRNQYMRGGDRNRSFGGPTGYPQNNMQYSSPAQNYRQLPNQQRPGQGYPPQFNQPGMPYGASPHPPRSPGFHGSQPGTPHMQHQQMAPNQMYGYPQGNGPQYNAYHMNPGNPRDSFGQQPQYNSSYGYFNNPYQMQPGYLGQQAPPQSPSGFAQAPPSAQQQYRQGQFNQQSQQMSRTPSHASIDRPSSSLANTPQVPPSSSTPVSTLRSHTPSQSVTSRTSGNDFVRPKRESKAIQIRDASGNLVTFDKKPSPAAATPIKPPPPAPSPVAPSPVSTPGPQHQRADSKTSKTAEEIRAQFAESVKKTQASEKGFKEEDATVPATKDDGTTATEEVDDTKVAKDKADAEAKAAEEKREREEAESAREKADAEAKAAKAEQEAREQEAKTAKAREDKAAEEAKKAKQARAEEEKASEAKRVEEAKAAEAKAAEAKAAEAKAAEAKAAEDKATEDRVAEEKASEAKAAESGKEEKSSEDAGKGLSAEDEEMERMIAEMEAIDKEREEQAAAYAAKKKQETEEKAAKDKAAALSPDEELKRQEREAEALEEKREKEREAAAKGDSADAEDKEKLFAQLKKSDDAEEPEGHPSPALSEDSTTQAAKSGPSAKAKPSPLKLDTVKSVEPPQATPAMRSLQSARMLQMQTEDVKYPDGIQSPNPALIKGDKRGGKVYDPQFLMQFQDVFKDKPTTDWEQKLKETIGDPNDVPQSAKSARTPMTGRTPSNRAPPPPFAQHTPMGTFNAPPAMGRGTTSQQRFEASNRAGATMNNPLAGFAGRPGGQFGMGTMGSGPVRGQVPAGMPHGSNRGSNTSRRGDSKRTNPKDQAKADKSMPLTASGEVKSLELSKNGWKPTSIGQVATMAGPDPSGHMAPDMVQRKVKAALNKMTPERFDKIADQILQIAAQSKDESDGRTLRQVIALTFEKACDEAHWASMYAKFCLRMLETMSNDIKDESIRSKDGDHAIAGGQLFRKYLLNRCQEDFEKGWEVNLPDKPEGEGSEEIAMLSDEYYVAEAAKRKGLGLIQFIGELFKLRMLSAKIMHQCFLKLLNFEGVPDETAIESLVKLARTVGATMDADQQGQQFMNVYFERIDKIYKTPDLPSRMHFMLLDIIDLRRSGWNGGAADKGPKTIQEIREEAAAAQIAEQARQAASRAGGRNNSGRGDRNFSGGQMPPPDYTRNTVATDELRKLNMRQTSRQASSGAGPTRPLGPTSMFSSSRSTSGRQGLGPGMRTGSMLSEARSTSNSAKKEDATPTTPASANAFSALSDMGSAEAPAEPKGDGA